MKYELKTEYLYLVNKVSNVFAMMTGEVEILIEIERLSWWFPTEDQQEIMRRAKQEVTVRA